MGIREKEIALRERAVRCFYSANVVPSRYVTGAYDNNGQVFIDDDSNLFILREVRGLAFSDLLLSFDEKFFAINTADEQTMMADLELVPQGTGEASKKCKYITWERWQEVSGKFFQEQNVVLVDKVCLELVSEDEELEGYRWYAITKQGELLRHISKWLVENIWVVGFVKIEKTSEWFYTKLIPAFSDTPIVQVEYRHLDKDDNVGELDRHLPFVLGYDKHNRVMSALMLSKEDSDELFKKYFSW